jgi:hypothetical protein
MATTVTTTTSSTNATANASASPTLQQMKTDLTAALLALGVTDAKSTDVTPKGFPAGVGWIDAYRMVARRVEDNNPSTPGNLVLSQDLLKSNVAATKSLAAMGVTSLSRFPKGTSVTGAIDALYRDSRNGKLVSTLAKSGIYELSAFPPGTTAFEAFKLIEDKNNPGQISIDVYNQYKAATKALKTMNITSLANFPRGTTLLDAQKTLSAKSDQMMAMLGISKDRYQDFFVDPNTDSLTAIAILTHLPDTASQIKPLNKSVLATLPASVAAAKDTERSTELARQASAAQKLIAMGYNSLAPFGTMERFIGKTIAPTDAYTIAKEVPSPIDLPKPTASNTERLFEATNTRVKRSYGTPNPVTKAVYIAPSSQNVKPNPPATTVTVVTAADVIAYNQKFWGVRNN